MRIQLRREGGVVFIPALARTWDLDSQALSEEEQKILEALVKEADFFCLPPTLPSGPQGAADQYHYTLGIEREGEVHTVHFTELSPNAPLQKLRLYIQAKAN